MKRSNQHRPFILAALAAVLCLGLTLGSPRAMTVGMSGGDTVRTLYSTLLNSMRNGPSLGARGRYAQIEPVVRRVFDVPYMAQLAVGPEWASLNSAQQQQVAQAFTRYIAAIYAERFDTYAGEQLQVIGEQPSTAGTIITTRIVKSNGEPVQINYLVRQGGGGWQIADVYLNGTISELATRRAEFASILRSQGINGLIGTLNAKADSLVMARAG
jgi:phospholipid transport system substrate-binding protein